jgi:putative ABC transport system ATP-binding protein
MLLVRPRTTHRSWGDLTERGESSRANQSERGQPIIETSNLVKEYAIGDDSVPALCGVSLRVDPGEFIAITGPSGSGKSTLMNLLGLLDAPTFGIYRFNGIDVSRLRHVALARLRNAKIGFVFQNFNLLPRLSAQENVELPLVYAGIGRQQQHQRARELLSLVGLDDRRHHRPCQLSGGQQQRVAIARALANRPALILADEPTGALDSQSGSEILDTLQSLNQRGVTVVLITHEPHIASYADRIVALRDGRKVADDQRMANVA